MTDNQRAITEDQSARAEADLGLPPDAPRGRPADVAIGLGSHDLGVPAFCAELYRAGLFPSLVFSGGSNPTAPERFPRGEAVHFREHALDLGVPAEAVLLEPSATNTGQNITLSRELLAAAGIDAQDGAAGLHALYGASRLCHRPQGVARGRGDLRLGATGVR